MKEHDHNFTDLKLQIPNFIGSKVTSFQSETIFPKKSKSKILTPAKFFWGTLGPPNFDTKNVHGISLCKKNLEFLSQTVSKWEPLELHICQGGVHSPYVGKSQNLC